MNNLDTFGMFDYHAGDDETYEYTPAEWAIMIDGLTGNAVSSKGNKFETTNSGLTLSVNSGICYILGRWGSNTGAKTITLDSEAAGTKRIDILCITCDISSRAIGLEVVKGTATTGTPSAPVLTQTSTKWQMPLYQALITADTLTSLTDLRQITFLPAEIATYIDNALDSAIDAALTAAIAELDYATPEDVAAKYDKPIRQVNVSVLTTVWAADATYTDYPFRAAAAITGAVSTMITEVVFSLEDAVSGILAPVAEAYAGGVYVYASEVPSATVIIKTITLWKGV